jgi:hypothetical protein
VSCCVRRKCLMGDPGRRSRTVDVVGRACPHSSINRGIGVSRAAPPNSDRGRANSTTRDKRVIALCRLEPGRRCCCTSSSSAVPKRLVEHHRLATANEPIRSVAPAPTHISPASSPRSAARQPRWLVDRRRIGPLICAFEASGGIRRSGVLACRWPETRAWAGSGLPLLTLHSASPTRRTLGRRHP